MMRRADPIRTVPRAPRSAGRAASPPPRAPRLAAAVLALGVGAGALATGSTPVRFVVTGEFVLRIDGQPVPGATIYRSEPHLSYLVIAPDLTRALLLQPATGTVETISLEGLSPGEGTLRLPEATRGERAGRLQIEGRDLIFSVLGKAVRLVPTPPLLGSHEAAAVAGYLPEYERADRAYAPRTQYVEALRGQKKNVRVLVFFGTWDAECARAVPHLTRLAEELAGTRIVFEFYGLPQPMGDDRLAELHALEEVPTAVVYLDDRIFARVAGEELRTPELAIHRVLCAL